MKEIKTCPICGSTNHDTLMIVKDHSTSQEQFNISQCGSCGFRFTNPIPTEDNMGRYYDNPNYISHTNSKRGLFGTVYQAARQRALKQKLSWIKEFKTAGVLIDYGSGTGEFLNYCQQRGWNVRGFEISDSARDMSVANYGLTVDKPGRFKEVEDNSVDVISLWHVLEHLENLQETVKTLVSKLKQGGVLVLALPNAESWDAKAYGTYWAAWDVPIHLYHFTKNDVKRLADMNGLSMEKIIKMPFDSYYVSLLSEEYKAGRKNWIKATVNGALSNLKAGKDNSSSLTYILKKA